MNPREITVYMQKKKKKKKKRVNVNVRKRSHCNQKDQQTRALFQSA